MIKTELDTLPAELDEMSRKIMQMEIEEAALKKETDRLSQDRLADLQKELAELQVENEALKDQLVQEWVVCQDMQDGKPCNGRFRDQEVSTSCHRCRHFIS